MKQVLFLNVIASFVPESSRQKSKNTKTHTLGESGSEMSNHLFVNKQKTADTIFSVTPNKN